jgi:hypothetical protein
MITYVLTVSQCFPATYPRKGQPTNFVQKIYNGQKIHTIRNNYPLWKKRINKINQGKAVLSLRYWKGKPYQTKQKEFLILKTNEVGIQKIEVNPLGWVIDDNLCEKLQTETIAKNDGLTHQDFKNWFKNSFTVNEPKAIIHFTPFLYKS